MREKIYLSSVILSNLGSYEIITFNKITFNNCRSGKDELITCILKIFVEYRFWLFKNA